MTALPLGDIRDRLSEVVSEVERTHRTTPGELAAIAEGIADAGRFADSEAIRAKSGGAARRPDG